jgi:hypothetical protein
MTDYNKVIENEKRRITPEEIRTIYLYPEGNFMRAFDWSAWLWCKHIKEFKVIRRKVKDTDETLAQIGCPLSSFASHIPDGATQAQYDDGSVVITLPDAMLPDDTDLAAMSAAIDEWKQAIPLAETLRKKTDTDGGSEPRRFAGRQPATLTGIMQQILAFPVEKKSMIDCVSFLCDIRAQLAKIV